MQVASEVWTIDEDLGVPEAQEAEPNVLTTAVDRQLSLIIPVVVSALASGLSGIIIGSRIQRWKTVAAQRLDSYSALA